MSFAFGGLHLGSIIGLLASPLIIRELGWPSLFYLFGAVGGLWLLWFESLMRDIEANDPALYAQLRPASATAGGWPCVVIVFHCVICRRALGCAHVLPVLGLFLCVAQLRPASAGEWAVWCTGWCVGGGPSVSCLWVALPSISPRDLAGCEGWQVSAARRVPKLKPPPAQPLPSLYPTLPPAASAKAIAAPKGPAGLLKGWAKGQGGAASASASAAAAAEAAAQPPPIPYRAFLRHPGIRTLMFTHFCHNWFHFT